MTSLYLHKHAPRWLKGMKPLCTTVPYKDMNRVYELAGGNKHEGSTMQE